MAEHDQSVIVIAYDGSPAARQAVLEAPKILGAARILVVTVWEEGLAYAPSMPADGMIMSPMVEPSVALEVDRQVHGHADRVANEGVALARSLGLDAQPLAVPDLGGVAETILDTAHQHNAAAIVVGSRGLTGLRAKLEGSTSKHLLKHAECPVLVVHEAAQDQA
jgi:nucleotide-binding universal stress UspA family protein